MQAQHASEKNQVGPAPPPFDAHCSGERNPKLLSVSAAGRAVVHVREAGDQPEGAAGDEEEAAGAGADHPGSGRAGQRFPPYRRWLRSGRKPALVQDFLHLPAVIL